MDWLGAIGAAIFIAGMYCVICGLLLLSWAALHALGWLLDEPIQDCVDEHAEKPNPL